MKNTISTVLSILCLALLFSCNDNKENGQSLEEVSKQELATALNERDQLLALVKDISINLEQIKKLENVMTIAAAHPNENPAQKTKILADMACLKERIQQRKAQLQELEDKLQNSTINNKELHETIEALRIQIDSQIDEIESLKRQLTAAREHIGELNDTVDSLNNTVSTVTGERNVAIEAAVSFENELNTCYYAVATKSQLKEHNIIESAFLRKTKLMKGDFDKDFFVVSDKRVLDTLPLGSKKVKILTNHPESSYRLVETDSQKVLKISDPDQFWSLTNYLVVQKD